MKNIAFTDVLEPYRGLEVRKTVTPLTIETLTESDIEQPSIFKNQNQFKLEPLPAEKKKILTKLQLCLFSDTAGVDQLRNSIQFEIEPILTIWNPASSLSPRKL